MNTEEIKNKYLKNDTILWQGVPINTPLFNKSDIFMIPFSVLFGGLFVMYAVISALLMFTGQSIMFSFIGITFLLIGIYILFFRLWYRKKRISRQLYFVTNKRVFAFDTMRDDVVFDIPIEETDLFLGNNSLILANTNSIGDFIYNLGLDVFFRKFAKETPSFKYIENINEVSKIIINNKEKTEETEDDSIFI